MEPFGTMLLGLAFFFVGVLFGDNLKQLSGRSCRTWVSRTTNRRWLGGLLGLVFAARSCESATAVTFIMVSMVDSGLIPAAHAIPVIAWANVGLTAFAFVASLNIHPFVIYLVGLSGVVMAFWKRPARATDRRDVCWGFGLLLLRLPTITQGAAAAAPPAVVPRTAGISGQFALVGFAIGILLARWSCNRTRPPF